MAAVDDIGSSITLDAPALTVHRERVHRHCYRMTGSLHDAEDLTQETFLRAWQNRSAFRGEASAATWLYRIATNLCLDFLRSKKGRVLPGGLTGRRYQNGEALPEPESEALWLEPYPTPEDQVLRREDLSLAFMNLLQTLPSRQRAALLVADVLGYSAKEAAELLDLTPAAVNSALQRARKTMGEHPRQEVSPAADVSDILSRFVAAWDAGDAHAIVALLGDTTMVMPPYPVWVQGRADILRVLLDYPMNGGRRWKLVPTVAANGCPAFGFYSKGEREWLGWGLQVVSFAPGESGQIARYYVFKGQKLLPAFGLPATL